MDMDFEQDEPVMRKAGRSKAFQEILDLLTLEEMEPHRPKPPAPAEPAEPEGLDAELSGDAGELPPMEAEGGGLTPEEIEELKAKLESMG
jgi:hypothetical protein